MQKTTESASLYDDLEKMDTATLLQSINQEDQKVALAVQKVLPQIEKLVDAIHPRMEQGGRLFYIGAGTSGRLGILDASECPPTFGVEKGKVVGLIAGGDKAIRDAVENAEDDPDQGMHDLQEHGLSPLDAVIGIAASGTTPYVVGAIRASRKMGMLTGGITCNVGSPLAEEAEYAVIPVVGPEFVTGSSRMKAGTAQKMVLNMLSTSLMIKLGRVKGNRMVDMQLSNQKLKQRGTGMIMEILGIDKTQAEKLLIEQGSVRKVLELHKTDKA